MSVDDRLPLTCLVPDGPGVIDVYDQGAALRIALVDRRAVGRLGPEWDSPGVYVLLDRVQAEGAWTCYVGKAPGGLRSRTQQHLRGKDEWVRALLVQRDTSHGFTSAHTAWLEGRLYDLVRASDLGALNNQQRPGDDTLPPHDRKMLEGAVEPIARVLRLIGYEAAAPGEAPPTQSRRLRTRQSTSVADLLDAGLVRPGAYLYSTNGVYPAQAVIERDGGIAWNGNSYPSLSAAGMAVRGGEVNGWTFWAVEEPSGRVPMSTIRARLADQPAARADKAMQPRPSRPPVPPPTRTPVIKPPPPQASPARGTKAHYDVTTRDLINAGLLQPGLRLDSTIQVHPAQAILNGDGSITWNRQQYRTLSAAARAVCGGQANGWVFWAADGPMGRRVTLAEYREMFLQRQQGGGT